RWRLARLSSALFWAVLCVRGLEFGRVGFLSSSNLNRSSFRSLVGRRRLFWPRSTPRAATPHRRSVIHRVVPACSRSKHQARPQLLRNLFAAAVSGFRHFSKPSFCRVLQLAIRLSDR